LNAELGTPSSEISLIIDVGYSIT